MRKPGWQDTEAMVMPSFSARMISVHIGEKWHNHSPFIAHAAQWTTPAQWT
jgi:hypothetical protein